MAKLKTIFFIGLFAVVGILAYVASSRMISTGDFVESGELQPTKYGAFLAAQHAVYANDFDNANDFLADFADVEYDVAQETRALVEFLSGKIPTNIEKFADKKEISSQIMYDAYLAKNDRWADMYKRFYTNKSAVYTPFRVWSGVGAGHTDEVLKFIEKSESNPAWKMFVRGQIYAETGDFEKAAGAFANVPTGFMNMNDYIYVMSFYRAHGMDENAEMLRKTFSSTPGGMFLSYYEDIPDWKENFAGIKNGLAFNVVQNVSHTQIMLYSDLSVLMLRFAQIIGPETQFFQDMINYYTGQFFVNTHGNYARYFDSISMDSPFYLFAQMQTVNSVDEFKKILSAHQLFIPALNKIVAEYIRAGDKSSALRAINRTLDNEKLSDSGRAYLLKRRAFVYMMFGDLERAQSDIHDVSKMQIIDPEILMIQARIWAAQNREIENAYNYAMAMVKRDPMDVVAWDTVAVVVGVREGNSAALEILEKIGGVADTCSALFEHLGDAYIATGKNDLARDAYNRAIELAEDGLVIVPNIKKKIRKIK